MLSGVVGHNAGEAPAAVRTSRGGPAAGGVSRLWQRQLAHYPANGARSFYLAITVLATVILYYELYIAGAVATNIIADYHMTFTYFVFISVVGNAVGAFASLLAGLADRWGRANLVVGGLLITGLLIGFGLPNASSKLTYLIMYALVSIVEGIVLVATPALIRDFSPQVGRGAAMGFWTLGPRARQPGRHPGLEPHAQRAHGRTTRLAGPTLRIAPATDNTPWHHVPCSNTARRPQTLSPMVMSIASSASLR